MDDAMLELMADDVVLARRLQAYADTRLSPDLATSSRLRARVLAVAHRQAALTRADAALAIVSPAAADHASGARASRRGGRRIVRWRGIAAFAMASALALGLVASALASGPGGALYAARVWVETLTLPADPSARAVAELERMTQRLQEADAAGRAGDAVGAAAALSSYATILDEASTSASLTGDPVATAALDAGLARNIAVLQALALRLPAVAADGPIAAAIERAIDRSDEAVRIVGGRPQGGDGTEGPAGDGSGGNGSGGNGSGGNGSGGNGNGQGPGAGAPNPVATPVPTPTDQGGGPAHGTQKPGAEPTRTPKPTRAPSGADTPSEPPGGGTGGDQGGDTGNDQGGG